jgi:hypothetical protein
MTMSVANTADDASPMRGLLPLWVGAGIYALFSLGRKPAADRSRCDGRTELYGEKFFVDHNAASGLMEPENLFRLLEEYKIEATLMRTQSAATKLLDHVDGWHKVYADDIATIHLRRPGAVRAIEPAVKPKVK